MKAKALFLAVLCAAAAVRAEPAPTALLSVATEAATLDLARPASQRPTAPRKPLPHSEESILKLDKQEQVRAREENRRVEKKNAKALVAAVAADRERQASREKAVRRVLGHDDFGRAVLKSPEYFSDAIANGKNLVAVPRDADGFVDAPEDARLVRLLFSAPTFKPVPAPIPRASDGVVTATLHVMLKIEAPSGKTKLFTEFDEIRSFPNDDLLGQARQMSLEALVRDAVKTAVAKVAETEDAR